LSYILNDLDDPRTVEAIEANPAEFFAYMGQAPGVDLYNGPDMVRMITGIPFPVCNNVFRAKIPAESLDKVIDETLSHFAARQVPMLWWTGPTSQPANLGERLVAHGLMPAGSPPGMAADLATLKDDVLPPPNLIIEKVRDAETLKRFGDILGTVFEFPPFVAEGFLNIFGSLGMGEEQPLQNYVAFLDGKLVGASSLFMGAGVAGIYNVGTLPEARGKGIGAAITLAPLLEARSRGYKIAILHASELGYSVYRRLGFQDYCQMNIFAWMGGPPDDQVAQG
jgi:GNAT superfamily N-acetyltransferase